MSREEECRISEEQCRALVFLVHVEETELDLYNSLLCSMSASFSGGLFHLSLTYKRVRHDG